MDISSTVAPNSHPKSILNTLKSTGGLPFQEILSSDVIAKSLNEVVCRERYNFYPPDVTLWTLLSQVLDADHSLEAAVSRVIAFHLSQGRQEDISSNTAAYSKARSKFPEEVISNLARESAAHLEEVVSNDWLWNKLHRLKLIDGSTVSMPDTPENQTIYPHPIARIVTVNSCATGAVLDLAFGPYCGKQTGEHALLRQLMHVFKKGDVVLGDCYYASFFLIAMLVKMGVDVIFPIHSARDCDFRFGKKLGKKGII